MGSPITSVDRTSWPRILLLVLAQGPLAVSVHASLDNSPLAIDLIVVLLVIIALGVLFVGPYSLLTSVRLWLTVALLSVAFFLGLRRAAIEVFLVLTSLAYLSASLCLFDAGRKRAASLAIAIVIFACCLAGVEAYSSHVRPKRLGISVTKEGKLEKPDDRLSIRLIPGSYGRRTVTLGNGHSEFDVTIHIDTDGTRRVPARPERGPKWYFFGGSQTFGFSVDDEDTIPSLIQSKNPKYRVYNSGINGFGAADVYLYLRDSVRDEQELTMCVYLMIDDHFRRAACAHSLTARSWGRNKPRFKLESGRLKYLGRAYDTLGDLKKLHVDTMIRSWVYRKLFDSWSLDSEVTQLVHAMIMGMKEACDSHSNCKFVLVLFPQYCGHLPEGHELHEWKAKLEQQGVFILDLRARFYEHLNAHGLTVMDYFYVDYHPRPVLNELMAEWISTYLRTILADRS